MSVFKRRSISSDVRDERKREFLVASLTTENPNFTRVANGRNILGVLDSERASLRVKLVKQNDCQAEFTCQVYGLDNQGREVVSSASLLQRQDQSGNQLDAGHLMPSVSLQLLASIQKLVTQSVAVLEDKINSVERSMEDKINSIGSNLGDKIEQIQKDLKDRSFLENKIEKIQSDFKYQSDSSERRIDDNLDLFENRVEDKIDNSHSINKLLQLDAKVSTELAQFRAEAKVDITNSLENLRKEAQDEQTETLRNISCEVEKTLNKSANLLASVGHNFDLLISSMQRNVFALINETETIREIFAGEHSNQKMLNATLLSNVDLLLTENELREQLAQSEVQRKSGFREVLIDFFTPKVCVKGMTPALTFGSFPYVIVNPFQDSALDFSHLCDSVTDGGGWIVVQRRTTGKTDFNRNWADYKRGFGGLDEDFWIGNDNLHAITSRGKYELRVELKYQGKSAFAHYADFSVADESDNYRLTLGAYDGTAGDSLAYNNGKPFSTKDRQNGPNVGQCTNQYGGGWWFDNCTYVCLNGRWGAIRGIYTGMEWRLFTRGYPASYSEMKIRRVD